MLKPLVCLFVLFVLVLTYDDRKKKVIQGLEKVLDYIQRNSDHFNIDGLLGVLLTEVHLKSILKHHDDNEIRKLAQKAQTIYNTVYPILPTSSPTDNIFKEHVMIFDVWNQTIQFESSQLSPYSSKAHYNTPEAFYTYIGSNTLEEELSDHCLSELIELRLKSRDCEASPECRVQMIENTEKLPGYGVTHRLLYLELARFKGCRMTEKWYQFKARDYCSQILWEATQSAELQFLPFLEDLLLEQISLCGLNGFTEFFSDTFTDYILTLQGNNGCFYPAGMQSRSKRKANFDDEGCVDHTNGLGASTLSLNLRYIYAKLYIASRIVAAQAISSSNPIFLL